MAHTPHTPHTDPMSAFKTSAPPLPSETSWCAVGGGVPKNAWLHASALAPATVALAMSTGGSGMSVDKTRVLGGGCIVDGRQGCMVDGVDGTEGEADGTQDRRRGRCGTEGEVDVTQGEAHVEHLRQFLPPGAGGAGGRELGMSSSLQVESVLVVRDVIYHSRPPPRSPPQPPQAYNTQEKEERGESGERRSAVNRGVRPESSCSSSVGSVYGAGNEPCTYVNEPCTYVYGAGNEPCTYHLDPRSDRSFSLLLFPPPITHTQRARDAGQQSVAGNSGMAATHMYYRRTCTIVATPHLAFSCIT